MYTCMILWHMLTQYLYTTHLCEVERQWAFSSAVAQALLFLLPFQRNGDPDMHLGSWMEGWTFPAVETGSCTTDAPCTCRSHSCVLSVVCNDLLHVFIQPRVFSNDADAAFPVFKEDFVFLYLSSAVFSYAYMCLSFSSSYHLTFCRYFTVLSTQSSIQPCSRFCYLHRKSLNWCWLINWLCSYHSLIFK